MIQLLEHLVLTLPSSAALSLIACPQPRLRI